MKRIIAIILLAFFINCNIGIFSVNAYTITIKNPDSISQKEITLGDMFIYFGGLYNKKIPETYKFIDVKIKGIHKGTKLYSGVQRLIYVDKLKNVNVSINKNRKVNLLTLYNFAKKIFGVDLLKNQKIEFFKKTKAKFSDLNNLKQKIKIESLNLDLDNGLKDIEIKKDIFLDVYKTLNKSTYYRDKLDKRKMLNEAIEGLTKATGDKFSVYFPATNNKNFREALTGKYEGIGAYVDMEKPGEFKIISPISGSPAEKSGLKGGDIVTKVDEKDVTEKNSIHEVVSWIKGPAGTRVILKIKRGSKIFDVEVIRGKIVIKEVEIKKLNYDTYQIKLKFFGSNISKEFKLALEEIKKNKNIKKIIFDLRGNGGGYLDQVANMLSYFVKKDEKTVVVKYKNSKSSYKSKGYDLIDFSKYKIIFLENSGTASASEIFIGTVKDYYSDATIIGEKSYGKGSVQTLKSYRDGSALKYTIAKWFTGKTETGIDGIGIKPDIEIKMDKYGVDEINDKQLQKALRLR